MNATKTNDFTGHESAAHPHHFRRPRKAGSLVAALALGASLLTIGACAPVDVEPMTKLEHSERVQQDLKDLFVNQESINGPLRLEEAIARALKYNLDRRLKLMEEAVSVRQLDVANVNLLPDLVANAGYSQRSLADSTFNETRTSTSTTSDRDIKTADLTASWNILDFGIGYVRAQQQADLALIVAERRRQVIHNIMQDARAAYWRAAAAERALKVFEPLLQDVVSALRNSERLEAERVNTLEALVYQRDLLRTLRQLESLRRDMRSARDELAVLMNVHPNSEFAISAAQADFSQPVSVDIPAETMELTALHNRSELRSEAYQLRIKQREARVAILQMIPGLNISAGLNYTSDSFKANGDWYDGSLTLTWGLMNLIRGHHNINLADAEQKLSKVRRLALSMAVIAQTNIAQLRLNAAKRDYDIAGRLASVEGRISDQLTNQGRAAAGSGQQEIRGRVDKALADLRQDLAYADLQAAYGQLIATLGVDPLVNQSESTSLQDVTKAVGKTLAQWRAGNFGGVVESFEPNASAEPFPPGLSEQALEGDGATQSADRFEQDDQDDQGDQGDQGDDGFWSFFFGSDEPVASVAQNEQPSGLSHKTWRPKSAGRSRDLMALFGPR